MDLKSFLTISQVSCELESGEAIIKFITKRFKKWVHCTEHSGQEYYNKNSLVILITLLDKINRGILPSAIEEELRNGSIKTAPLLDNLISSKDINFEERKVKALEKSANAEIKKSLALEKNNEIGFLKIEAMKNIAKAISQITTFIPNDLNSNKIDKISESIGLSPSTDTDEPVNKKEIDDLSILIDKKPNEKNNIKDTQPIIIDDLALLLDNKQSNITEVDNLSELIVDIEAKRSEELEIDDLATLLPDSRQENKYETDDLSILIKNQYISNKIDDLSMLINETKSDNATIDDLSTLIDFKSKKKLKIKKLAFSPKDDFEKYKSEIINLIIDLKDQGFSKEETCEQFNKGGILTFSGKTKWSVKLISQIYQLIENAA
jgi:hypothetical protein